MLSINNIKTVYIAAGITNFRKSVDELSLIVQESFDLDPFSEALFVFNNRDKTRFTGNLTVFGYTIVNYNVERLTGRCLMMMW